MAVGPPKTRSDLSHSRKMLPLSCRRLETNTSCQVIVAAILLIGSARCAHSSRLSRHPWASSDVLAARQCLPVANVPFCQACSRDLGPHEPTPLRGPRNDCQPFPDDPSDSRGRHTRDSASSFPSSIVVRQLRFRISPVPSLINSPRATRPNLHVGVGTNLSA